MRMYDANCVRLKAVPPPEAEINAPAALTDETMALRRARVLAAMRKMGLDALVVYGDVEHGGNFEYLTGFVTRFEEGLLILLADGRCTLITGNENRKLAAHSRIPCACLHYPPFSLPNQPMAGYRPLAALFAEAGIRSGQRVGVAGWKYFTCPAGEAIFDVPAFILQALRQAAGEGVVNATELMIGPEGVRRVNSANEVAHYAFGAEVSWACVMHTMDRVRPGIRERELADTMNSGGQRPNVVTICAAGPRYEKGNLYPTDRRVRLGDPVSLTCGYRGGLSSRAAWAATGPDQLPEEKRRFVPGLAAPYFAALATWLENIRVGMAGGELYDLVEQVLPRERFGWSLCPGHLTAEEEWLCSPIYEGSQERLESGMLLQLDIIPAVPALGSVGCENGLCLADAPLRRELSEQYPQLYGRMTARRAYAAAHLGIRLSPDVMPLCGGLAYYRPYLMDRSGALVMAEE